MIPPRQPSRAFGRRKELPRIIFSRGGQARSFTVRPWLIGSTLTIFATFAVGYFAATLYLLHRDGFLASALVGEARMRIAYEDRIALLRAEIDRLTSRHLITAQSVESRAEALAARQDLILRRQDVLDRILAGARDEGLAVAAFAPQPLPRPARRPPPEAAPLAYAPEGRSEADVITGSVLRAGAPAAAREKVMPLLDEIRSSLDAVETRQSSAVDALREASQLEAERLSGVLERIGVREAAPSRRHAPDGGRAAGGPFLPLPGTTFVERVAEVEALLGRIEALRRAAAQAPLRSPVPGAAVTSRFGHRLDPFLGRPALHSGIDFEADAGAPVRATADGRVRFAGWKGGYGRLVEIGHAHGLVTRYAHLSAILVAEGDRVASGALVGRVGSTGRSTGPHLHYETRQSGAPVDPAPFLAAGRELRGAGPL